MSETKVTLFDVHEDSLLCDTLINIHLSLPRPAGDEAGTVRMDARGHFEVVHLTSSQLDHELAWNVAYRASDQEGEMGHLRELFGQFVPSRRAWIHHIETFPGGDALGEFRAGRARVARRFLHAQQLAELGAWSRVSERLAENNGLLVEGEVVGQVVGLDLHVLAPFTDTSQPAVDFIWDRVTEATNRAILVLGEPGSGKTWLLQQLVGRSVKQPDPNVLIVPVFDIKTQWIDSLPASRAAELLLRTSLCISEDLGLQELLDVGSERRIVFLFDGFDEAAPPGADDAIERLTRSIMALAKLGANVVVALREDYYVGHPAFEIGMSDVEALYLRVAPLTKQAHDGWLRAKLERSGVPRAECADLLARFWDWLEHNDEPGQIRRNVYWMNALLSAFQHGYPTIALGSEDPVAKLVDFLLYKELHRLGLKIDRVLPILEALASQPMSDGAPFDPLCAGLTPSERERVAQIEFIYAHRHGNHTIKVRFRHALLRDHFWIKQVINRLVNNEDVEVILSSTELSRRLSQAVRYFMDARLIWRLENCLTELGPRASRLEVNLWHLLLVSYTDGKSKPRPETLRTAHERFASHLERMTQRAQEVDLTSTLAAGTVAIIVDRWYGSGHVREFVNTLLSGKHEVDAVLELLVSYSGSCFDAICRSLSHLEAPDAYQFMALIDALALEQFLKSSRWCTKDLVHRLRVHGWGPRFTAVRRRYRDTTKFPVELTEILDSVAACWAKLALAHGNAA